MPKRKSYFLFFSGIIPTLNLFKKFLKITHSTLGTNSKIIISNISNIWNIFFSSLKIFSQNALSTQGTRFQGTYYHVDVTQKMKRNVQGTISNFLQPVEYRLSNISTCAVCYRARARCISRILMNFNLIIVGVRDS